MSLAKGGTILVLRDCAKLRAEGGKTGIGVGHRQRYGDSGVGLDRRHRRRFETARGQRHLLLGFALGETGLGNEHHGGSEEQGRSNERTAHCVISGSNLGANGGRQCRLRYA